MRSSQNVAAGVVIFVTSFAASADQITVSEIQNYALTNSAGPPVVSQSLGFQQFDPLIGALLGVTVTITYDGIIQASILGLHDFSGAAEQTHEDRYSSLVRLDPVRDDFAGVAKVLSCETTALDSSCSASGSGFNQNNNPLAIQITDLSAWIGTGLNFLDLVAVWSTDLTPRGMPQDDGSSALWEGTVEVAYTYDDRVSVPEPGTLALLGIGLAGMGLARRKRKNTDEACKGVRRSSGNCSQFSTKVD